MTATLLMLGLKSLLVAALALAALRLTRSRSAAERSTIAHLGLFALVALPIASLWLPPLPVTLPAALSPVMAPVEAPALQPAAAAATHWTATPAALATPKTVDTEPAAPLAQSPSMSERAAFFARYAYAAPAIALLLLTLVALARLFRLRARAEVLIDPHWLGALGRAQRRMAFKNGTALLTSRDLHSPVSWGLLRPTIVVNESALAASGQAEAIIAHELAHVIQLDWAKLMLSRVATAVFWFNPLAWVLAREAHQLREEAADDAVLAADIAGTDYAELLVGVARHENRGLLLGAHGVAPARNSLRRRVARVLDKTPARGPSGRSWVAGFTAGMMVMAAPLAAISLGPARAKDDPAPARAWPAPAPAATASSWSTRAGDAPNQPSPAPRHNRRDIDAELARTVYGLHDAAPPAFTPADADPGPVPGTQDYAEGWAQFGRSIGESVAQAFTGPSFVLADQAPAARPAPHAVPAPVVRPHVFDYGQFAEKWRKNGRQWSDSDTAALVGVTDDYRKEMAEAGFPNATLGDLTQARAMGVTGDYVADLRKAGINGTLGTYAQARAQGLTSNYVDSLRDAGISGSINDYVQARNMGLTGPYVQSLRDVGLKGNLQDYARARNLGVTAGYVAAMNGVGVRGSIEEYQQMRALGITSAYVAALHRNGTMITDPQRLIEIKTKGWRARDGNSDP